MRHALAYLKFSQGALSGSVAKGISDAEKEALMKQLDIHEDDLVLIVADKTPVALQTLGALRVRLAHELDRIPHEEQYKFLWVTEFPMYEWSEEAQHYVAAHHPFTAPKEEDVGKLMSDPAHEGHQ